MDKLPSSPWLDSLDDYEQSFLYSHYKVSIQLEGMHYVWSQCNPTFGKCMLVLRSDAILISRNFKPQDPKEIKFDLAQYTIQNTLAKEHVFYCITLIDENQSLKFGFLEKDEAYQWLRCVKHIKYENSHSKREWRISFRQFLNLEWHEQQRLFGSILPRKWSAEWHNSYSIEEEMSTVVERMLAIFEEFSMCSLTLLKGFLSLPAERQIELWCDHGDTKFIEDSFELCGINFLQASQTNWIKFKALSKASKEYFSQRLSDTIKSNSERSEISVPLMVGLEVQNIRFVAIAKQLSNLDENPMISAVKQLENLYTLKLMSEQKQSVEDGSIKVSNDIMVNDVVICIPSDPRAPLRQLDKGELLKGTQFQKDSTKYLCYNLWYNSRNKGPTNIRASRLAARMNKSKLYYGDVLVTYSDKNRPFRNISNLSPSDKRKVVSFSGRIGTHGDSISLGNDPLIIMNGSHLVERMKKSLIPMRYLPLVNHNLHYCSKAGIKAIVEAEMVARTAKHVLRSTNLTFAASKIASAVLNSNEKQDFDLSEHDFFWEVDFVLWMIFGNFGGYSGSIQTFLAIKNSVTRNPITFLTALERNLCICCSDSFLKRLLANERIINSILPTDFIDRTQSSKTFGSYFICKMHQRLQNTLPPENQLFNSTYVVKLQRCLCQHTEQLLSIEFLDSVLADIKNCASNVIQLEILVAYLVLRAQLLYISRDYISSFYHYATAWVWIQFYYRPVNNGSSLCAITNHPVGPFILESIKDLVTKKQCRSIKNASVITTRLDQLIANNSHYCKGFGKSLFHALQTLLNKTVALYVPKKAIDILNIKPLWLTACPDSNPGLENGKLIVLGNIEGLSLEEESSLYREHIPSKRHQPISFTPLLPISNVSCGYRHAAIVTFSGYCLTFGHGECGRLGHGTENSEAIPKIVQKLADSQEKVKHAACGREHTLVVTFSGKLYGFGWGEGGRLGIGDVGKILTPQHVAYFDNTLITNVACGREHSLVSSSAGDLYSFGVGLFGRLGHGTEADAVLPARIHLPATAAKVKPKIYKIVAGDAHSIALTQQGVFSWGFGMTGALGHGTQDDQLIPKLLMSSERRPLVARKIACGAYHSAFLIDPGKIYACGDESVLGGSEPVLVPTLIANDMTFLDIACGSHSIHSIVRSNLSNKQVFDWDTRQCSMVRNTALEADFHVIQMSSGGYSALAITELTSQVSQELDTNLENDNTAATDLKGRSTRLSSTFNGYLRDNLIHNTMKTA